MSVSLGVIGYGKGAVNDPHHGLGLTTSPSRPGRADPPGGRHTTRRRGWPRNAGPGSVTSSRSPSSAPCRPHSCCRLLATSSARVALTVLVYDQTRSPLLAAVTFTASLVPNFLGGILLSPIADRLPRRQVMIGADVLSALLVAAMAVPGVPLALLIILLAAVTMVGALFQAARAAIDPDILAGDRYVLGTAITLTTLRFAQVLGFALGGVAVGLPGPADLPAGRRGHARRVRADHPDLDPGPAAVSRARQAATQPGARPAARPRARSRPMAGLRLAFAHPAMRTSMLFGWLCAFYDVPEGVATPLAAAVGGGAVRVGLILASEAFGSTVGALCFAGSSRPAQRIRFIGPLAVAACGLLTFFAAQPGLAGILIIVAVSGLCSCYRWPPTPRSSRPPRPNSAARPSASPRAASTWARAWSSCLAGAAAERFTPDTVICAVGAIGALCAVALAVSPVISRPVPAGSGWPR